MKLYECLEAVRVRNPHFVIEADGRQYNVVEYAKHGDLAVLLAEAQVQWQQVKKLYPDEQVGYIEVAKNSKSTGKRPTKQIISIRYKP